MISNIYSANNTTPSSIHKFSLYYIKNVPLLYGPTFFRIVFTNIPEFKVSLNVFAHISLDMPYANTHAYMHTHKHTHTLNILYI